jgi:hypothetical protein
MTSYSQPSVHPCPGCDAFFLRRQLRSANFYSTRDWSDGVPTASWGQDPLVRCNACAALFWLDDVEAVGIMPELSRPIGRLSRTWMGWRGDPQGQLRDEKERAHARELWGSAQYIGRASFEDVAYVLARSEGTSLDRLLWLRMRIWWGLNDRYRSRPGGSAVPEWPVAVEQRNMEVILDMLQGGEVQSWHMIQQGELLRLLGRFDESIAILKAVTPDGHSEVRAVKIEKLARTGDTQVRELSQPTW